jgi:hypothetical protein
MSGKTKKTLIILLIAIVAGAVSILGIVRAFPNLTEQDKLVKNEVKSLVMESSL